MAQTTAILRNNPSSRFGGNDASLASLVNLEISDESPSKYEFDINLLLTDNEITSKKQYNDKDTKEVKSNGIALHSLSDDTFVPSTPKMAAVVANNVSLGALAKNHLKNNETLNDWCADADFSLADLLCSENGPTSFSNARTQEAENLNFFDIYVDAREDESEFKFSMMPENEISYDLSDLMLDSVGSVNVSGPNSTFVKSSCDQNSTKSESCQNFTDAFLSSLKKDDSDDFLSFDSFHDVLSEVSRNKARNSTGIDVLSDLELSSGNNSEISNENQNSEQTSDDEQVPDIDLNFCIKKNSTKDNLLIDSLSPNSVDSGFIEMSSAEQNFISNVDKSNLYSDAIFFGKAEKIKSKQSLFSRALSAKLKVDKERVTKLKWVKREFFKKLVPSAVIYHSYKEPNVSDKIVDHTTECIITSNFLKISNHQPFA